MHPERRSAVAGKRGLPGDVVPVRTEWRNVIFRRDILACWPWKADPVLAAEKHGGTEQGCDTSRPDFRSWRFRHESLVKEHMQGPPMCA